MVLSKKMKTKQQSSSGSRRMFDAVEALESQDQSAKRQRIQRTKRQASQSQAALSQTQIYQTTIETRILMQRALQQQQQQNSNNNNKESDQEAIQMCNQLLEQLLRCRSILMAKKTVDNTDALPDYATMIATHSQQDADGDDDDIDELQDTLQSEYDKCRDDWKDVFNRRHKDVRLHAGLTTAKATQFKVLDSSFWQQIEATVQHEDLRRQQQQQPKDFDDTKVYQHLLKEFVTTNQTGNESAARQRLNKKKGKSSSSSNSKQQVDRRASKGRKIRYHEIPKLVNFTFPLSRSQSGNVANLDEDEWFRSLFGGVGKR